MNNEQITKPVSIQECQEALLKTGMPPVTALVNYMHQLLEWNEKINVTGAKTADEFAIKHIADVWAALQVLESLPGHVVDVGSGGGLPGIALAIMVPDLAVTLVERRQKKASVLSSMVSHLGLEKRVKVISRSFEEIKGLPDEAEFWFRGFLPGPKLATYFSECFPRADLNQIVLMKGPAWPQEKLDIMSQPKVRKEWVERFGGAIEVPYHLPKDAGERLLVFV